MTTTWLSVVMTSTHLLGVVLMVSQRHTAYVRPLCGARSLGIPGAFAARGLLAGQMLTLTIDTYRKHVAGKL
jgi:hypothetical protein